MIPNFDPSKFTVDPNDGTVDVVFDYTTTDAEGVESDPATVLMPFFGLKIGGNVYNDGNGDGNVAGIPINKPEGVQLYVTLVDASGNVVASRPVADDGSYLFDEMTGIMANVDYTIILSTTPDSTTPSLPSQWVNSGENLNENGGGNDGSPNGIIKVHTLTEDVFKVDFGINKKPVSKDEVRKEQENRFGQWKVPVPSLVHDDNEDGKSKTITILTLPTKGTLYYDGKIVQKGQVITDYDPSKLTVDPYDGDVTIVFIYTVTDAEGAVSDPATVTLPFTTCVTSPDSVKPTPLSSCLPSEKGIKSLGATDVVLTWKDNSTNEFGFKIYQDGELIAILGENETSYHVTGLEGGKTYNFEIRSYNSNGEAKGLKIPVTTKDYAWMIGIMHSISN